MTFWATTRHSNQTELHPPFILNLESTPEWTRTTNLQLRRLLLYPIELRAHQTITKLPNYSNTMLSGRQDSNLRPPAPKAGALTGLRYAPILYKISKNQIKIELLNYYFVQVKSIIFDNTFDFVN